MAFTNNPRSFTTIPSTSFADSSINGTSNTLTAPWGDKGSIWTYTGVPKKDTKTDTPKSQHFSSQASVMRPSVDQKSGSGMLLEGSQAWGLQPAASTRSFTSIPGIGRLDTTSAKRAQGTASNNHQTCLSPTENISPTTTRPPTINLTTSDFKAKMGRGSFAPHENQPPVLYTKFNAASPAIDSARNSMSPEEARKSFWSTASQDPSQPPSRHSNHEASSTEPPPSVQITPASTRNHSLSSQRNAHHSSFHNGFDQMIPQFGQMSIGQNGHAAALRKASEPHHCQNGQRASQFPAKFGSVPFNDKDDVEDLDPYNVSYITADDVPISQSNDYSRFSSIRFGHAPAPIDFRHGNAFTSSGASSQTQDFARFLKLQGDWTPSYGEDFALSRDVGGMSEPQSLMDLRRQQMLACMAQYTPAMYNPYAMPSGMQANGSAAYYSMYPMGLPALDAGMAPRETLVSEGVQSAKLYDFKNAGKNNKRWELNDIFDHIAEFAGDQYGSRFIQTKLETANSDEKDRVFREIERNAIPLMTDVFGNYVIQKFFDHGHQEHKRLLANKMRGQVLNLSLQMYGCRVVQKALEHILVEQQTLLVGELENHVIKCVKDQNGNHVIQKAIERCAPEKIRFIYQSFLGQVQHLSLHPYGCRVIQRCLERPEFFPEKPDIMNDLHKAMHEGMISDQYGNYVVQHVVQRGSPRDKAQVFRLVICALETHSKHKFASNVVEKCIEFSDDSWRREVVNVLTAPDQRRSEGDTCLVSMIKDNFGNYVIQKLLDKLALPDYHYFTNHLQVALAHAKRHGCGKQIAAIESRMRRFVYTPHQQHQQPPYTLGIPYGSHYASVANTPPPLTADTQSLQSSTIPSVNGDAVEGAQSLSRKGSDPLGSAAALR